MAQPKFWTLALTILLAVVTWLLFGCAKTPEIYYEHPIPATSNGDTDAAYLQRLYAVDNEQFFGNKLPRVVLTDIDLHNNDMADSVCSDDGSKCTISFNIKYTAAPRVAEAVMLHEMCHIKLWRKHLVTGQFPPAPGSEFYHDQSWRGCMLTLDAEGAFRQINIDYYQEDVR